MAATHRREADRVSARMARLNVAPAGGQFHSNGPSHSKHRSQAVEIKLFKLPVADKRIDCARYLLWKINSPVVRFLFLEVLKCLTRAESRPHKWREKKHALSLIILNTIIIIKKKDQTVCAQIDTTRFFFCYLGGAHGMVVSMETRCRTLSAAAADAGGECVCVCMCVCVACSTGVKGLKYISNLQGCFEWTIETTFFGALQYQPPQITSHRRVGLLGRDAMPQTPPLISGFSAVLMLDWKYTRSLLLPWRLDSR